MFSVAMCVYAGDNPEWFDTALESVINQTVKPDEIVLVVDGPIPEIIQNVIDKYIEICNKKETCVSLKIIRLEVNSGHGIARRESIKHCSNDIVALMDADDISVPHRFKEELEYLLSTGADIVGGDIAEFIDETSNIIGCRKVPANDDEIKQYTKKRCPFNQMTVMFKKEIYNKAGGYLDWYCNEDYYLWLRMYLNGAKFANTGTVLVNVRVGKEMYQRRGGVKYFKSEAKLQKYMLDRRIINISTYLMNVGKRFIVQVLLPNKIRGWVFRKFARE
jgi:glycosyltransferase involved in cell wall biosynthesis